MDERKRTYRVPILVVRHDIRRVIDADDSSPCVVDVRETLCRRLGLVQPPNLACQSPSSTTALFFRPPAPDIPSSLLSQPHERKLKKTKYSLSVKLSHDPK